VAAMKYDEGLLNVCDGICSPLVSQLFRSLARAE
jgi:hypothetical protein